MNDKKDIIAEFHRLEFRQDVARMLGIEDRSLRYFLYGARIEDRYTEIAIKKRNGGTRTINAPDKKLKQIQRKLLCVLKNVYKVKPSAYGFIEKKNNALNAQNHCKRNLILNIDLKDFFCQIHFGRVMGMLKSEPYNIGEEAALVIAQIVCYKGKLPQGAPTSPIISNMICAPLDTQLMRLAKKYKLMYTRYADDITFSTYKLKFPTEIVDFQNDKIELGRELKDILEKNSFKVNNEKIYLRTKHERQEVTGLVVNKFVNLKREYIRNIRAVLDSCEKKGIYETAENYIKKGFCNNQVIKDCINKNDKKNNEELVIEWFEKVLKGKIEYIKAVRGENNTYYMKYALKMNKIFEKKVFELDKQMEFIDKCEKWCFIIESNNENDCNQGSGFLLKNYGVITNHHVVKNNDFYDVKKYTGDSIGKISREINLLYENEKIDYSLYSIMSKTKEGWELEESDELSIGMKVKLVGFPHYSSGNMPYIEKCEIASKTRTMRGGELYVVSGRIMHGASGGVVLNNEDKVIGIIQGGSNSMEEEEQTWHGFIPISDVIMDIKSKKYVKDRERDF